MEDYMAGQASRLDEAEEEHRLTYMYVRALDGSGQCRTSGRGSVGTNVSVRVHTKDVRSE
jgi:hypothetical protein